MTIKVENIGDARLILGDCREVMAAFPPCFRVDAVVTDPPYGVNLGEHGSAKDGRSDHVLVKSGYESYQDTEDNLLAVVVPAIRQALGMAQRGLVFCAGSNVWHFPRADLIAGVYVPAAQGRNKWGFSSLWPCLLYGRSPDLNLGAKATAFCSNASAEKNGHPCPKPMEWMIWAVSLASRMGESVIDPFMGSGTTGVACAKLGRKFIGIELEPKYFDIACRRIEEAYKQPDFFVAPPNVKAKTEAML